MMASKDEEADYSLSEEEFDMPQRRQRQDTPEPAGRHVFSSAIIIVKILRMSLVSPPFISSGRLVRRSRASTCSATPTGFLSASKWAWKADVWLLLMAPCVGALLNQDIRDQEAAPSPRRRILSLTM